MFGCVMLFHASGESLIQSPHRLRCFHHVEVSLRNHYRLRITPKFKNLYYGVTTKRRFVAAPGGFPASNLGKAGSGPALLPYEF